MYSSIDMRSNDKLRAIAQFMAEYASRLIGSGVHTSRVLRNSKRIGVAYGVEIRMTAFQRTIVLTIYDPQDQDSHTEVVEIPSYPISFEWNSELSSLSWEIHDKHLTLEQSRARYEQIVSQPKMSPHTVLLLVGLANASFCKLFGGDWPSIGIVLLATLLGFYVKQQMALRHINHFVITVTSALLASMVASTTLMFPSTSAIALGTSVLFLIPGVPLINGVIDIVEGHVLFGFSRLIQALLLVICIALGLSFTLMITKNGLI